MAHDRAKRFSKLITQTPPNIGPGTYNLSECSCPPRLLAERYPFLCGARRKMQSVSRDAWTLPGPGAYDIKEPRKHISESSFHWGGVSIDFTDARFKYTVHEGPGPIYDVSEDLLKSKRTESSRCICAAPAGRLWLIRPPRSPLPRATAVPGKYYTGYDVDELGCLRKNPPIKHSPPGFYDVPRQDACYTTFRYKGNFWSRMSGRTGPRLTRTPGPGDYEHETKKTAAQIRDEEIRQAKRGAAKQLRYLDILSRRRMRENFPAPNSYAVKGAFDEFLKIDCECDPYSAKPPPFNQTSKRLTYEQRTDGPGPGAYDPKIPSKCLASIIDAPFGVYADRFQKITVDPEPAPSEYHTDYGNLAYESQKRFKQTHQPSVCYKSFASASTADDREEDSEVIDGASRKDEIQKCNVYHAAFRSRTARFPDARKADVPDPGAYDVLTAFKANRDKCNWRRQQLPASLGSLARRLRRTVGAGDARPDPTTYEVGGDIAKNVAGGLMLLPPKKPRMAQVPGPNHYCLHPYVTSSVLKKSFNYVLSKPKVIAALEKQEKETLRAGCKCTRKKLRWFAKPTTKYKPCQPPRTPF